VIVVDTNLVAYSVLPGERTVAALAVRRRDPEWIAPALLWSELRNLLVQQVRLRGLAPEDAEAAYRQALELAGTLSVEPRFEAVVSTCIAASISAYDAEFVLAARELGLVLVTADRWLIEKFSDTAVSPEQFVAGEWIQEP